MKVFRRVKQNLQWVLINVTGLSIAVACSLIILLYILQQTSYDRFHSKADYIYRITLESNQGASSIHPARVYGDLRQMVTDYPVIERMVRLVPFRNAIVKIGDQKFYSRNAFLTDSSFFKVFDFKVISGNSKKAFSQPGQVFISRTLAIKYFGTLDVIGKEISILHQQDPNFKFSFSCRPAFFLYK
jgi:putative ABC transport system permease protein